MKRIILYEIAVLLVLIFAYLSQYLFDLPAWYMENLLFAHCTIVGGVGGVLYCLRAIYLNRSVRNNWDNNWQVWYYLRPLTSAISGFVSFIFLKAGLLILDASMNSDTVSYGYLAVAVIAGYNVDNFLKRIEVIAQSTWGIKKSRAGTISEGLTNKTNDEGSGND